MADTKMLPKTTDTNEFSNKKQMIKQCAGSCAFSGTERIQRKALLVFNFLLPCKHLQISVTTCLRSQEIPLKHLVSCTTKFWLRLHNSEIWSIRIFIINVF